MFREIQHLALKSEKQNFVGVTHVTQCFYANSFNIILWSKETCVFLWSWTYLWTIKCLIPIESTLVWDVEHSLFTKIESQRNTRDVEWPCGTIQHNRVIYLIDFQNKFGYLRALCTFVFDTVKVANSGQIFYVFC